MASLGSYTFDECHAAIRRRTNKPVVSQNPGNGAMGAGIMASVSDPQAVPFAGWFDSDPSAGLYSLRGSVVTAVDDHGSHTVLVEEIQLEPSPQRALCAGVVGWFVSCVATLRATA